MKKKLIKSVVDAAQATLDSDTWIWDTEVEGFGVRAQPSGRKTYVVRYRARDARRTQRKMALARCSDMTPDQARALARKVFAQVAEGMDPAAERRPAQAKAAKTVEQMFKAYVAHMRARGRTSAAEVERALLQAKNNAATALGRDKAPSEVTPMAIVDYVADIFRAGHRGAADKHRSYIASAFQWAIESANDYTVAERQDWGLAINPASGVPRDQGAVKTRDRNLTAPELRMLWADTAPDAPGFTLETAACIRILIGCGQRVQETLRIDGKDIALEAMEWRMPAEKTKGRKLPHTIPLPEALRPTFEALLAAHGDGPLFPARAGSADALIDHRSIMQALERWQERASAAAFQTRDLRRTWKSRAHDAGVDRFTRDLIQQHAKSDTGSKSYDRAEYLPQMREAMAKWSAWLTVNVTSPNVVQLLAA